MATNTGGPTESIVDEPASKRTGWLCPPEPQVWADALAQIVNLTATERKALSVRSKTRAKELFGMEAMAKGLETVLKDTVAMGPVPGTNLWMWMNLFGILLTSLALFLGRYVLSKYSL